MTEPGGAPDYFGTTDFIGRTVTVTGTVTRALGETAFELDARDFGDDSLLVVSAPGRDVTAGDRVQVTGNVQAFVYTAYADRYRLGSADAYAGYAGERFLVSADAMATG